MTRCLKPGACLYESLDVWITLDERVPVLAGHGKVEFVLEHRSVGHSLGGEVVVQIQIQFPDETTRSVHRLRERFELRLGVQVVVAVLGVVVGPPLRCVASVQSHVVAARDVWELILGNREPELGFIDLYPRRVEPAEQGERISDVVTPACVSQFDGHRTGLERTEQPDEVVTIRRIVLEAWRKLCQHRTKLPRVF